jgi:DHA1 family tetracycline resistance protein-like MFS transporter
MTRSRLDFNRVLPIFALVFVDLLGLTIVLPLLHLYAAAFGASPLKIGLVAAAFPLSQLIGVPMMGTLSDRYGRKPLLLISQVTTFLSFILLGLANSLIIVILSRVIDGLFGANIATAQAALSDITDEKTRAQGLGITGAAFGLGFIFGPLISLVTLQFTNDLSIPAYIAAVYSFLSILLTLFVFKETLPPESRTQSNKLTFAPTVILNGLRQSQISLLLVLMFAQQLIFFGFEALLGLFTLTRLGMLGQGNSFLFLLVGIILVLVQLRFIGPWSRKYGERNLAAAALALVAVGMILLSVTPHQPHPLYVRQIVEKDLLEQNVAESTQAIIGTISVDLPSEENRGIGGVAWLVIAVIPLSVGAGLLRPTLNSLLTQRAGSLRYGSILGMSQAFSSAANAIAPLLGGLIFQQFGATPLFFSGGLVMGVLAMICITFIGAASTQEGLQASASQQQS